MRSRHLDSFSLNASCQLCLQFLSVAAEEEELKPYEKVGQGKTLHRINLVSEYVGEAAHGLCRNLLCYHLIG